MKARPLAGLRIADFTWIGAGSFTTKLFSDLGADVIKIESAARLDQVRTAKPYRDGIPGVNRSGYFSDRNSNKRSITLDLKNPRAQKIARDIIRQSDIVANNFTPGTMEKFGLGYADVVAFKPDIIYLAMSMNGDSGPEKSYVGFGLTMGALTGLQILCGNPGREPVGTGTNFPDHIPNPTHGAFAVLAALRHRRLTGRGQLIDLAQIEPTISLLGPAVVDWTANKRVATCRGNERPGFAPHGVYPCRGSDRWIAIAVKDDVAWSALTAVLDPKLASEARFADAPSRWLHRHALDKELASRTATWQAEKLTEQLQSVGVAAGTVADTEDLLRRDPQLAHREHWAWLEHAEMGRSAYSTLPFRMSNAATHPSSPAPLLGEHTAEVCRELLGMDAAVLDELGAEGALR